ncbi:hypothetical protein B5G26_10200 [Anaerotignum lactatifermentans]|uniref:DUF1836 domain-containing protein n=1 Tax=Anaerotignum lactatifermentans TaxID=160404 RepID=A0A1Y3U0S8_9FIRM|nr:hypothetical protein B5G26_10200 [Anaerotignum lactatifermentans]
MKYYIINFNRKRRDCMGTYEEILETFKEKIKTVSVVEIADIPKIDLYMDQVTTFMDQALAPYKRSSDGKVLTKTMINNYTKAKVLPPPIKKKYGRTHIMLLIMIFHLKSVLSIKDIATLFQPIFALPTKEDAEKQTEKIYAGFIYLQKATLTYMQASAEGIIDDTLFQQEIMADYDEEMKKIMLILLLAIRANAEKHLAEKVLDLYFY